MIHFLDTPTRELALPARAAAALERGGIRTLGRLLRPDEADLLLIPGVGPATVQAIRRLRRVGTGR